MKYFVKIADFAFLRNIKFEILTLRMLIRKNEENYNIEIKD